MVYPHGEWLGNLTPEMIPGVLDAIVERSAKPSLANEVPLTPANWRGRMGLGKEEQTQLFASLRL